MVSCYNIMLSLIVLFIVCRAIDVRCALKIAYGERALKTKFVLLSFKGCIFLFNANT